MILKNNEDAEIPADNNAPERVVTGTSVFSDTLDEIQAECSRIKRIEGGRKPSAAVVIERALKAYKREQQSSSEKGGSDTPPKPDGSEGPSLTKDSTPAADLPTYSKQVRTIASEIHKNAAELLSVIGKLEAPRSEQPSRVYTGPSDETMEQAEADAKALDEIEADIRKERGGVQRRKPTPKRATG